ncbi:DUF1116 domain-containing protein [Rhodoplanes serenus]|uniref:DUF1116 domain-containing protein n=1 Tax=Rhodoplanes serenus TaxID=200615 RepID=A0A9X5ASE0_9BRAD|nr:DUF1116 domain-containing protein [Rhodoplanes serenus]MTW17176.1 DUF1116 domain-containing protein [Rhodoplanes serenus]
MTDIASRIEAANREAHRRMLGADPVLVDVMLARDAIPNLPPRTVLHAGPPISWERMCGPMRSAVAGALVFEGWASDLAEAETVAASGGVRFEPNHHYDGVGPMTGITTPGVAVLVVENRAFGNRAFCTVNEGMGNVMRFGGNDQEVRDRLAWIAGVFGPAVGAALRRRGGVPLKGLIARGLTMGDEMHMRNAACTGLILRELAADLAEVAPADLGRMLRFISGNDMFFLNIAMAMAKAVAAPAHGIPYATVVTTMARNGTDFGIRLSSTGDAWFTGPAQMARGLLFAGFTEADGNPDIGDSCITETVGLGGCAMAASPAVVGFVGAGALSDAIGYTRSMSEITVGPNPEWTMPTMAMAGVPTAIDVRKVLSTGILPVINTAITNRQPGRGQIGAGIVNPPLECFQQALMRFAEVHGAL